VRLPEPIQLQFFWMAKRNNGFHKSIDYTTLRSCRRKQIYLTNNFTSRNRFYNSLQIQICLVWTDMSQWNLCVAVCRKLDSFVHCKYSDINSLMSTRGLLQI